LQITPITVPILELPQYCIVETVIITEKFASENNISVVSKICKRLANNLQISKTDKTGNAQPARIRHPVECETPVTRKPMIDRCTMTVSIDNGCPTRSRAMQTEIRTTVDVGIQCESDSADEWELAFATASTRTAADEEHERQFLVYVSANTNLFPNGMLECRVCGEVASVLQEHHRHMAMHFAPPALCTSCGKLVRNEFHMQQHNLSCSARRSKSKLKRRFKCPHLQCGVLMSSWRKLAKHIEAHLGESLYCCLQCRKSFTTLAHFLVHRLLDAACSKSKHIYLGRKWSTYSRKAAAKRCTVCRRQFGSTRDAAWHQRRCMFVYQQRLLKMLRT
ncbi:hypothetical protein KR044_000161, partial [Drosophila immigrans]